jgi:CutA1 divalent ion tolerance protein
LGQRFEVKEKCHGPRRVRLYDLSRPCRGGRGGKGYRSAKTRVSLAEAARAAIEELHAYDVPAISVIPIESADRDYFNWPMYETKPVPM